MSDLGFTEGMMVGMGRAIAARERGDQMRMFDWDKAATLIRERKPSHVEAGLSGDWTYTGGTIYENGQIVDDSYTYLASMWATPQIEIDGERIDCWTYGEDSGLKWPDTARAILNNN